MNKLDISFQTPVLSIMFPGICPHDGQAGLGGLEGKKGKERKGVSGLKIGVLFVLETHTIYIKGRSGGIEKTKESPNLHHTRKLHRFWKTLQRPPPRHPILGPWFHIPGNRTNLEDKWNDGVRKIRGESSKAVYERIEIPTKNATNMDAALSGFKSRATRYRRRSSSSNTSAIKNW